MFDGRAVDASGVELLDGLLREAERHRLCFLYCAAAKRRVRSPSGGHTWQTLREDEYPGRRIAHDGTDDLWQFLFKHRGILERYAQAAVGEFGPGEGIRAWELRDGDYVEVEGSSLPTWSLDDLDCALMERSSDALMAACRRLARADAAGGRYASLLEQAGKAAHDRGQPRWYSSVLVRWEYLHELDTLIADIKAAELHRPNARPTSTARAAHAEPAAAPRDVDLGPDPLGLWSAAEAVWYVATRLKMNAAFLVARLPNEYDSHDAIKADHDVAEKHGYRVIDAARKLGLDATPLVRVLRQDRLWEYPVQPGDNAIFEALQDLCERVSVEARVACAAAGIDVDASVKTYRVDSPPAGAPPRQGAASRKGPAPATKATPKPPPPHVPPRGGANGEPQPGPPRVAAAPDGSGVLWPAGMPKAEWREVGLILLLLMAQTYHSLLENALRSSAWATMLDMELNGWYLWTVDLIRALLSEHDDLREFPGDFDPPFEDLFPATIRDVDWEDMVAPGAERFLADVQRYVMSKGAGGVELGAPAKEFVENTRARAREAMAQGKKHAARMQAYVAKLMSRAAGVTGQTPGTASSTAAPTAPAAPSSASPPPPDAAPESDEFVTLDQAAAVVARSKRSLERRLPQMPPPHVQGGGGKASLWKWKELRPWLQREYRPDLPERFPRNVR